MAPPSRASHRDPGDAWVEGSEGTRYWGRFGAAGVLVHDASRGVLLQHRALWSHHGGTWGIPGGALHHGESALDGALREAREEAGVPQDALDLHATTVLDRDVWSYTTVLARTSRPFEPRISDAESLELAWFPLDSVDTLALHPAFGQAWPTLRSMLGARPVVLIDAANVVGAVPDGWWRDRQGATERMLARVAVLAAAGVPAATLELPGAHWYPRFEAVVEAAARDATAPAGIGVLRASGVGDDTIAARAAQLRSRGHEVTVVTSDRGLRQRIDEPAQVRGARWLLELLPD